MKSLLLTLTLCALTSWSVAQNYYVAIVKGEVYYQDKLLKKKDKVTPKGKIRFKDANSYVKLSGPGGLYTLSPDMGKASGNEFLLALSNEVFPSVRPISSASPSGGMPTRQYWKFGETHYSFIENTELNIEPSMIADGKVIAFLHETEKGLFYKVAKVTPESNLVIRAEDFDLGKADNDSFKITQTAIVQIGESAILEKLIANYATIEDVAKEMPTFDFLTATSEEYKAPPNQILDVMIQPRVINEKEFVKDLRFQIKQCRAKTQDEFLINYMFKDYLIDTYGSIYQLQRVLEKDLGLPNN